ncbi:MAG: response regulator transcription factor [Candidatus Eisenbacteria bacterium]|nr:response regulator transcription factor [Candidatus Eisenbacteria bacterium]
MASSRRRILVIEDDRKTAATVRLYLEHEGFETVVLHDGRRGLEEALASRYDLIVLDLMLPGVDGQRICRSIREEMEVPIVMLTARTTEEDRVRGLDIGADDYVTKPFSPRELVARVRAVLRRTDPRETPGPTRFEFPSLSVDLATREVRAGGRAVSLTPTEFAILQAFVRAPQRVFTREELIERALGPDYEGFDRTVDAHVMNLRRKIEPDRVRPTYIQTVFGVGYRFAPAASAGGDRDSNDP